MSKWKIDILFEDEDILVVNKPALLLSIPDRWDADKECLYHILASSRPTLLVTHRLDKDTSGAMVFAKNEIAHKSLNEQFSAHENKKIYWAVVAQQVISGGRIESPIASDPYHPGRMILHKKGKPAITDYEPLESFRDFTLLRLRLHTGRTHQIRVHMSSIGFPLAIDPLYGNADPITIENIKRKNLKSGEEANPPLIARLPLHAYSLEIIHPISQAVMEFTAELPKDMKAILNQLRKWGR